MGEVKPTNQRTEIPLHAYYKVRGFQGFEAPKFRDKVVRLSALRTGHLYPPGNIPRAHFC